MASSERMILNAIIKPVETEDGFSPCNCCDLLTLPACDQLKCMGYEREDKRTVFWEIVSTEVVKQP